MSIVRVDRQNVARLAGLLQSVSVPAEEEEPSGSQLSPGLLPDVYFALVAVCHQTTPVGSPALAGVIDGKMLRGWDFLREAFLKAAQESPEFFRPEALRRCSAESLQTIIQVDSQQVSLTDLPGRASLIGDIGARLSELTCDSITTLADRCDFRLEGRGGLLDTLSGFRAYRDPVRKKSAYFLSLMISHRLWEVSDPQNLPAPVDYHEVRGHLRLGTVKVEDATLRTLLMSGQEVSADDDVAIRSAVLAAIADTSRLTGRSQSQLHYLFWNLFRACCSRDFTHCEKCPPTCSLPARYAELTAADRRCMLAPVCDSRALEAKLKEHVTTTDFY